MKNIFILIFIVCVLSCGKSSNRAKQSRFENTDAWIERYWELSSLNGHNLSKFLEITVRSTDNKILCFWIPSKYYNNRLMLDGSSFRLWLKKKQVQAATNFDDPVPFGFFYEEHKYFSLLLTNSVL